MVASLGLGSGTASAEPSLGARVVIEAVNPASGMTAPTLRHALIEGGAEHGLSLRVPHGAVSEPRDGDGCGDFAKVSGGVLFARLDPDRLELRWRAPSGCWAAYASADWRPGAPPSVLGGALADLSTRLRARVESVTSMREAERSSVVRSGPNRGEGAPDPAIAAREKSLRKLAGTDARLAEVVRPYVGMGERKGADGSDGFISAGHFVAAVYREAFGLELPTNIKKLVVAGPRVPFALGDASALRPGDLVFLTSHAGIPRAVQIYLGNGRQASVARIRGVVIGDVPKKLNWHLYAIAVRPEGLESRMFATGRGEGRYSER